MPIVSLGTLVTSCKLLFFLLQGFYHKTIPNSSHLQVPLFISLVSLCLLCLLVSGLCLSDGPHTHPGAQPLPGEHQLLRAMQGQQARRQRHKQL